MGKQVSTQNGFYEGIWSLGSVLRSVSRSYTVETRYFESRLRCGDMRSGSWTVGRPRPIQDIGREDLTTHRHSPLVSRLQNVTVTNLSFELYEGRSQHLWLCGLAGGIGQVVSACGLLL